VAEITNIQKKIIWTVVRKNGIDEEMFRDFLERHYGTRSTRELTEAEASDAINSLRVFNGERYKPHTRTWGITDKQFWKARTLAEQLGWDDPRRLDGLVKKMFYGKDRLELLNKEEATKLIVALGKMGEEAERGVSDYA